jgi:hypothetical protein
MADEHPIDITPTTTAIINMTSSNNSSSNSTTTPPPLPLRSPIRIGDHSLYPILKTLIAQQQRLFAGSPQAAEAAFESVVADIVLSPAEAENYLTERIIGISDATMELEQLVQSIDSPPTVIFQDLDARLRHVEEQSREAAAQAEDGEGRRKVGIPQRAQELLMAWIKEHQTHPYPNDDEKDDLMLATGITPTQLNNWFA